MVVFQHPSVEALVRELQRNPALLQLCGFDPLGRQGRCRRPAGGSNVVPFGLLRNGVPAAYNFSRFLRTVSELEAERGLVTDLATALRGDLLAELPGFGEHLGYDGKDLPAHATGRTCEPRLDLQRARRRLPHGRTGGGMTAPGRAVRSANVQLNWNKCTEYLQSSY